MLKRWTRDVELATGRVARCEWMRMPDKININSAVSGWVTVPGWLTEGEHAEVQAALQIDPLVAKVLRNPMAPVEPYRDVPEKPHGYECGCGCQRPEWPPDDRARFKCSGCGSVSNRQRSELDEPLEERTDEERRVRIWASTRRA